MDKTAELIKRQDGFNGDAKLFKLSPPIEYERWNPETNEDETKTAEYVLVSATVVPFTGAETYIFPATPKGEVEYWGELQGSYRGGLDHEEALNGAGYSVA